MTLSLILLANVLVMPGCGPIIQGHNTPLPTPPAVRMWLTTADLSQRLKQLPSLVFVPDAATSPLTITIDTSQRFQQMLGFGVAMTDTSAWLLWTKLKAQQRSTVMTNLFDPIHGIGLSVVRVPMGASDFIVSGPYSYDDMPGGQTDPQLAHFSIQHDLAYIIPALQAAQQLNPNLKLMANPWSPPGWMKTSDSMIGGGLRTTSYSPLAAYFVRFLQAYQAQGVPIYAISPQNEPGLGNGYPHMDFPAEQESTFVAKYLGPALANAGLQPKIWIHDSNWDLSYYASTVLGNPSALPYIDGVAFHCYAGDPAVMSHLQALYPSKNIYETECATGIAPLSPIELIIRGTRNWARTVVMWNVAEDAQGGPHIGDGCPGCVGTVTVDQATGNVVYNRDYYELGQASKFVMAGAFRVASNDLSRQGLENVAFLNPDGSKVLIVHNASNSEHAFRVRWNGQAFSYDLPAGAIATFVWH